ncbi:MAG: GTPase HflX [Sedimentisphaerales bacterium]|nr:GTPase HflX [Sedimentisphaerales bacterium]
MENKRNNIKVHEETALLVSLALPKDEIPPKDSLAELQALAESAGAVVVGRIYQNRRRPHPASYIGRGKAKMIAEIVEQQEIDTVIFDGDLSPAQIRELEEIIDAKVIDRSELILDIFATRARTHEARLQVDLAQMQYTYPRLTRMWSHLDTVVGASAGGIGAVGGIGTRGTGEKQLEIDRRIVQKRLSVLRKQIAEIDRRKKRQVRSRGEHFTVSLVGYTNAGKSTLMNLLTNSETYVEDQLFATLDTKTARWELDGDLHVLLSDTVGFVRDLPHHLVASFRATLEEAIHADLLLHVVDVSHPWAEQQLRAAQHVLNEIGCAEKDILLVFNKIDKALDKSNFDTMMTLFPEAIGISARKDIGIEVLRAAVIKRVSGEKVRLRICCSVADGRVSSFIRANGTVLKEDYSDSVVTLEVMMGKRQLPGLEKLRPQSCEIIATG